MDGRYIKRCINWCSRRSVKDPFDDFTGPQNIGHLFITFKANLFVKDFSKNIK